MNVKAVSAGKNIVELELEGEDVSIADIIHQELLEDQRVVFAGVKLLHPLERRVVLKVQTSKGNPAEVTADNAKKAAGKLSVLRKELSRVLEGEAR